MQAKASVAGTKDLYAYWGRRLYDAVMDEDRTVVNLASKEYSRCVEDYLRPGDRFLTCIFGELQNGRVVQKGTMAKMARGEMVRYMAALQAGAGSRSGRLSEELEKLKDFAELGYRFHEELSSVNQYLFIREEP